MVAIAINQSTLTAAKSDLFLLITVCRGVMFLNMPIWIVQERGEYGKTPVYFSTYFNDPENPNAVKVDADTAALYTLMYDSASTETRAMLSTSPVHILFEWLL